MKFKLFYLIPALVLSACSTVKITDKTFSPIINEAPDSSVLYFYRPHKNFNSGGWVELFIDEEKKFGLVNNSYGYIILKEGKYNVRAEGSKFGTNWWPGPATAIISVLAGREYYIRVVPMPPESTTDVPWVLASPLIIGTTAFSDNSKAQTDIREIEKSQARQEIYSTRRIEQ